MSVVIVYLKYESGGVSNGWNVDIHGLLQSHRDEFKVAFATAIDRNQEEDVEESPATFLSILPNDEPQFKTPVREPPLQKVTGYLKKLAEFGYRVVSTDSTSDENGYRRTTLWTLQKDN